MNGADSGPRDGYSRRLEDRRAKLAASERWLRLHSYVQMAILLGALVAVFPALNQAFSIVWEVVPVSAFATLFVTRDRLLRIAERRRRAVRYFDRCLTRLNGQWTGTGDPGDRYLDPAHPYAQDLDLFGNGSLFELLCDARTPMGQNTLAAWLMEPALADIIRERQSAVAELAPRLDLREDIAVLGENARGRTY